MSDTVAPEKVTDTTPDHVDAILRDPNAPDDVRFFFASLYNAQRYLDGVEFHDAEGNGFFVVQPRADVDSTAVEEPPTSTDAEVTPTDPDPAVG